jgi:hypothetical protein
LQPRRLAGMGLLGEAVHWAGATVRTSTCG